MEGVSQLYQKQAEIFSSRETNDRRRHEGAEMADRIGDLEKRLEEQVSFTDRHREKKVAATAILGKRLQTIRDLILKLDHVARQNDVVHFPRLALAAKGVLDHQEGIAAEVLLDLRAAAERLARAVSRHDESRKREELTKSFPAANLAKDNESKELTSRAEELEAGVKVQEQEQVATEAARSSSAKVVQHMKAEQPALEHRIETTEASHQQTIDETTELQAEVEEAERSDHGQAVLENTQKDSVSTDTQVLEQSLAQLSIEDTRQGTVEAEQAESARTSQALALEQEKVDRESKQDDPKVLAMRAQLQKKSQKKDILTDQNAAAQEKFAAHAINEPEFGDRKAEHQALTSKIATIRSTQASTGARKAAHEEEMRRVARETTVTTTAIGEDISAEGEEQLRVAAEREEIAAAVTARDVSVATKQAERASIEAEREEVSTVLELRRGLEDEQKSRMSKEDPEHDRAIAQDQATTLNLQAEDERTRRAIENLEEELETKEAAEVERRKRRSEADKHRLFTESVTRRSHEETMAIETTRNEEVNRYQEEIMAEDEKFRAAWAEASQSPPGGGVEERLQEELAGIDAQKAAEGADVESTESRVQRLRESSQP